MPGQRRRWGGRMLDPDSRTDEELAAEDAYLDALEDQVTSPGDDEDDLYRLDYSHSRGGSAWPGSWGGGRS